MADEQHFPTAIVPTRAEIPRDRFDTLAKRFGDPMAKLFLLQNCGDVELEFKAAAELMPYRYPRLKQQETNINAQGAQQVNIQINVGTPPPQLPAAPPVAKAVDPLE